MCRKVSLCSGLWYFWFLIIPAPLPALSASRAANNTLAVAPQVPSLVVFKQLKWLRSTKREEMNSTNFKQHFYLPLSRLGSHNSGLPIFSFGNSCLRARPSRVSLWGAGTVKQSDVNAMVNLFTELVATALVILSSLRPYQELPLFSFQKLFVFPVLWSLWSPRQRDFCQALLVYCFRFQLN